MLLLIEIPFLLLVTAVSGGVGCRLIKFLKVDFCSGAEQFVFAQGLGLGVLSFVVLGLGLIKILYAGVLWALLILLGVLSFPGRKKIGLWVNKIKIFFPSLRSNLTKKSVIVLGGILSIHLLFNLIGAIAPVTDFDSMAYHLAIPQIFIKYHQIFNIVYMWPSNIPLNMEMLYTLGMLLRGETLAQLMAFFVYGLTLLAIYTFCRNLLGLNVSFSLLPCVVFSTSPLIVWLASTATADIGLTFYCLLAIYGFFSWTKAQNSGWLVLSATMAGLAAATKYSGLIPLVILALILVIWHLVESKSRLNMTMKSVFIFGGLSLIVTAPWYIKSYIYTGNPVFPFFYQVFGGKNWSLEAAKSLADQGHSFGRGMGLESFLLLPWNMTMHPSSFGASPVGPLFLAVVPLLLFMKKVDKVIKYLVGYTIIFVTGWFLLYFQVSRYLLSVFPLLSIVSGYVIYRLMKIDSFTRRFLWLVVLAVFSVSLLHAGFFHSRAIPVVFGLESKEQYLARRLPFYPIFTYANGKLTKKSKILLWWTYAGYYLEIPHMEGGPNMYGLINYKKLRSTQQLLAELRQMKITHIIVDNNMREKSVRIAKDTDPAGVLLVKDFIKRHLFLIKAKNSFYLYKLRY